MRKPLLGVNRLNDHADAGARVGSIGCAWLLQAGCDVK